METKGVIYNLFIFIEYKNIYKLKHEYNTEIITSSSQHSKIYTATIDFLF